MAASGSFREVRFSGDLTPGAGDSPSANDLVTNTDHLRELQYKAARMERANMRISNIDLTITDSDEIQYNFVVDDSEAGSMAGSPSASSMRWHSRCHPSVRSAELQPVDTQTSPSSSRLPKSNSITSASDARREMTTLAELPAADPVILSYFEFVEEVLADEEADAFPGYPESNVGAPSEYPESTFGVYSEGVDCSPALSLGDMEGSMRRCSTTGHGAKYVVGSFDYSDSGPVGMSFSPAQLNGTPQRLVRMQSGNKNLSSQLSNTFDQSCFSPRSDYPASEVQPSDNSVSASEGGESPPWRKPSVSRLGGNCDELKPTNSLGASASSKRRGRKLLHGLFKGKGIAMSNDT